MFHCPTTSHLFIISKDEGYYLCSMDQTTAPFTADISDIIRITPIDESAKIIHIFKDLIEITLLQT